MQASDIGAHRFGHQAMATEFEILGAHPDRGYAKQAVWAAFDLLDRLEGLLSRFRPNSDISRINRLVAGEVACVSRWTTECIETKSALRRGAPLIFRSGAAWRRFEFLQAA